jgi:hypothetical protein
VHGDHEERRDRNIDAEIETARGNPIAGARDVARKRVHAR